MTGSAETPTPAQRPEPVVRGFLFADLRGYTEFVERAGDTAAADLLDRYRYLVRAVVAEQAGAEQAGAEIRTEGDSFYLVFPSPSAAVRAGLELVARAAADAADHPDDPILIGIGIHAGESAETAEGYVGSAVNLAARICSVAKAGEVLVSDTVRSLTRTSLPVTYTSRGRRALKGVAEPVELYAVAPSSGAGATAASGSRSAAATSTRARAGLIGLGAAVVILAVIGIAAFAGGGTGSANPSPSGSGPLGGASPSSSGTQGASHGGSSTAPVGTADLRLGPLPAGTYRTTIFTPGLTLTVPDGWENPSELANWLVLGLQNDPMRPEFAYMLGERLTIMRPTIGLSPCAPARSPEEQIVNWDRPPGVERVELPPGRQGLIEWVRANPGLRLGEPTATSLGDFDTLAYDIEVSGDCDLPELTPVEIFTFAETPPVRKSYVMKSTYTTRWYIAEVDAQAVVFALDSSADFEAFERKARSILTSLRLAE